MHFQHRICFINGSGTGSTGNIVNDISNKASKSGFISLFIEHSTPSCKFNGESVNILPHKYSYLFSRIPTYLFDGDGFRSKAATKRALNSICSFKPDIFHIHNPHSSFINIKAVIDHALNNSVKVVWTLHDAWTISGRCGYPLSCTGWKEGCPACGHKDFYPKVLFSRSAHYYEQKHTIVNCLIDAHAIFVSPSKWLQAFFLRSYPNADVRLIRNGVDISVFTCFGAKNEEVLHFARGRKVVGGTSLSTIKGGTYFEKMASALDQEKYCVVVVGAKKKKKVSNNYLQLQSLSSRNDMAAFYRSIDVLASPTQNDNFPTTHLESISCGTPVITFDVGGAAEMIQQGINGLSVPLNDINRLISATIEVLKMNCDRFLISSTQRLSSEGMSESYVHLYEEMLER